MCIMLKLPFSLVQILVIHYNHTTNVPFLLAVFYTKFALFCTSGRFRSPCARVSAAVQ